uniref:Uncharacterized protein LOC111103465 isoform X8 n=1 Tax=Crassostrea virginica TaxID=6565 RepID=A0A8B8AP96_CRAVI|nr:uncharacterized protein LOC111103465 isoform X8 [Crassostrea virginica]
MDYHHVEQYLVSVIVGIYQSWRSTRAGSEQNLAEEAESESKETTEKEVLKSEPETVTEDNNNTGSTKEKIEPETDQNPPGTESQFGGSSVFIPDPEDEGDSVDAIPYFGDFDSGSKDVEEEEDVEKPVVVNDSEPEEVVEEEIISETVKEETSEVVVGKESVSAEETADDSEQADDNDLEEVEKSDVIDTSLDDITENNQSQEEMPGREDEVLSPSLQKASFRYRWGKTIRTNSRDVVFFPSYKMEEAIRLTYDEPSESFFSPELEVATGVYRGNLVIDGNTYPIEDVIIKHYTFEADIYIKDAILKEVHRKYLLEEEVPIEQGQNSVEDEVEAPQREQSQEAPAQDGHTDGQGDMSHSPESSLNLSSKFEELVKKQISQEAEDGERETFQSGGRRTPIGDVSAEPFQDGVGNVVDDVVERPHSRSSVKSPQKTVEDIIREVNSASHNMEVYGSEVDPPARSAENSLNGSIHIVEDVIGTQNMRSPLGSPYHSHKQTPVRDLSPHSPQRSKEGSLLGSDRLTPTAGFVDDVLGQSTPITRSEQGSARQTPQPMSNPSSLRNTPQLINDVLQTGGEKLYSAGSVGSGGSRPQSLTSEQELNQYFEKSGSQHSSVPGSERSSANRTPILPTSNPARTSERTHSSSSLPVITTQQRLLTERRSMTPDNHIRVPGSSSPAFRGPNPGANRSNVSSRASDRTLTPGGGENGFPEDAQSQRIQDLEDNVRNLRKLLSSREIEVHDLNNELKELKSLNKQLTEELDTAKMKEQRSTPAYSNVQEVERRYNQLQSEKEIMAGEIVKLRDQIEELRRGRNGQPDGQTSEMSQGICYNPNNPYALQRKIADLESQIQDLQEANETAVGELANTERKLEDLQRRNEALQLGQGSQNLDLQEENQRLHDQISKMYEKGYGGPTSSDSEHRIQIEIQQLREDNRALRERNYKLHEESMQLREELMKFKEEGHRGLPPRDVRASPRDTRSPLDVRTISPREVRTPLHSRGYSLERSVDLGSERFSKDRPITGRLSLEQEDARLLSSIHRQTDSKYGRTESEALSKYRPSMDRSSDIKDSANKEESLFSRSIQKAETRLRSSLERADANFRKIADGEDAKPRFDRFSRLSNSLDRQKDRRKYELEDTPRSSEVYRSGPDGGMGDREPMSATLPRYNASRQTESEFRERSRTPDAAAYNTYALDTEWHRYDRERRRRNNEISPSKSCSELSKSPYTEPSYKDMERSNTYHQDTKPATNVSDKRGITTCWKNGILYIRKEPVPQTSVLSERGNNTDYLTSSYHKPTNPALSVYQSNYQNKGYDVMKKSSLYQEGEDSDTGTDILVNTRLQDVSPRLSPTSPEPLHRRSGTHQYGYRRRRDSLGSEGSLSEDETEKPFSKHPRSKSADGRVPHRSLQMVREMIARHQELLRTSLSLGMERSGPVGTERSMVLLTQPMDRTLNTRNPPPPTANLRTVTPGVLTTQHNRNMLTASTGSLTSLTSGMKPFSPRSPGDINLEDVVKFSRAGGKLSQGAVKFVGHLPGRSDAYLGVELDKEDGKHDGKFEGMRYFRCKPNKGVFVAFNKVVMAWTR